jgi:magnesium transporter
MIHTFIVTNDLKMKKNVQLKRISDPDVQWFWLDFDVPSDEEIQMLYSHFHFHPLAIEDCLHFLQRPKMDYFSGYDFYVLQTLNKTTLTAEELDVFVGKNFIVTFHLTPLHETQMVQERIMSDGENVIKKGPFYIFYLIMDKIVDGFFPPLYEIEDEVNEIEIKTPDRDIMESVFEIRSQLLKLRRTILPMQELLYRLLNSERVIIPKEDRVYFLDIYDHLLKLSEMIESNREMTNDIRDSYISLNSHRMNIIMKTLTVLSSVFIPLTFIASIYGMNFEYIPELRWRWGYFGALGLMGVVGTLMILWLWRKGWFK